MRQYSTQGPTFAEPEYVQAVIAGDADRLAARNPLPWDSFLRRAAAELKMSLPQAAALLNMQQAGPPPTEAGSSAPSTAAGTAAPLEWNRKSSRDLLTTHARRLVFRAHYVFAFAAHLNERCRVFPQGLGRSLADARAAATKEITQDGNADAPDGRPMQKRQGAALLDAVLQAGQCDAERLVQAHGCQAAPVSSASATLVRLLAPLEPGRLQADAETQAEHAAMLRAKDQAFLIAGRFFRTYRSQGPYSATIIGDPDEPPYRVPGPGQHVAGVTIGSHSVPDGAPASKANGKPLLIALVRTSDCDHCPHPSPTS